MPKKAAPRPTVPRLVTAAEVARRFGVTTKAVYQYAACRLLPGVVRIGTTLRFDAEALDRYVRDGGRAWESRGVRNAPE